MSNERIIWDYFQQKGMNEFGIAGLMGNLFAESGLNPKNLQQTYERKLSHTDESYTNGVDRGTYRNFVKDSAGYGLAQWTFWSRKEALLKFAKSRNVSIGDLYMQLDFLWNELNNSFPSVLSSLFHAKSVREASNAVLFDFERPASWREIETQNKRCSFGQKYFDMFTNHQNEDIDLDSFIRLFMDMRKEFQNNDCSEYSKEARQWAVSVGLINGNGTTDNGEPNCMWKDFLTREQLITVLFRFFQLTKR